jgi:hypothetical protein
MLPFGRFRLKPAMLGRAITGKKQKTEMFYT